MTGRSVDIFFYGLFMDVELLRNQRMMPLSPRRAFVDGFTLRIGQRATLVPTATGRVYGIVLRLDQHEIVELYSAAGLRHYLPEAILVRTLEGQEYPALCYTLPEPPSPDEHNPEYAAKLKQLLQSLNFPSDYIASI